MVVGFIKDLSFGYVVTTIPLRIANSRRVLGDPLGAPSRRPVPRWIVVRELAWCSSLPASWENGLVLDPPVPRRELHETLQNLPDLRCGERRSRFKKQLYEFVAECGGGKYV